MSKIQISILKYVKKTLKKKKIPGSVTFKDLNQYTYTYYHMSHIMRKHVYALCDQQRHPRSLISVFVVRCLDSTIQVLAISKVSILWLSSEAEQASLSLSWSQIPKTGFSTTKLISGKPRGNLFQTNLRPE